jgi:hypothetical protein
LQNGGEFRPGFTFQQINPWTDGGMDRGGGGAQRCAHRSSASGRSGAPKLTGGGATEREEHTGSSSRASPGLGRRRGGRAMVVKVRRRRCSVRGLLRRGERGKGAGRGAVKIGGGARLL